jgi:hypothetical protein
MMLNLNTYNINCTENDAEYLHEIYNITSDVQVGTMRRRSYRKVPK